MRTKTLAFVMAGGKGTRLEPLTEAMTKARVLVRIGFLWSYPWWASVIGILTAGLHPAKPEAVAPKSLVIFSCSIQPLTPGIVQPMVMHD